MPTTEKRSQWWTQSVECWQNQTYQWKRLLIGPDVAGVRQSIPDDERIEIVICPKTRSLGSKRNFLNRLTRTPLIAHWDDDDWSHPNRLADQIERLKASGRSVTGYRDMEFRGDSGRYHYTGAADYALGTSLLYQRDWWERNPFAGLQIGEDNDFVRRAWRAGQLVSADCNGHMIAHDHPGNTSARQYANKQWRRLA